MVSIRNFDSIRSSVSTNYSEKDSLTTFNKEFRDTSDFGDLIENIKNINNLKNASIFTRDLNGESNPSNINNSNKFSFITKISKFSEPLACLKNSEIPSRRSMGIFNKNSREIVGVEENYLKTIFHNKIEKDSFIINLPSDKSSPLENKTLDNNIVSLIRKAGNA